MSSNAAHRLDGILVPRGGARVRPPQAVRRWRDRLHVEDLLRAAKAPLGARPIHHCSDAAIRGHALRPFLALALKKELGDRCRGAGLRPEWGDVRRGLDRLQAVELAKRGNRPAPRTPVTGIAGKLPQAARVALPPNIRERAPAARPRRPSLGPAAVPPRNPAALPPCRESPTSRVAGLKLGMGSPGTARSSGRSVTSSASAARASASSSSP
jgi:hypothetical protein